jgi:multisubunit Na+/H+ antiporter MnhB subunit
MNKSSDSMSLIVRTTARIIARLMLLFGFYIILHGQVSHGGGFAGGVIVALVFTLLMLAFGRAIAIRTISRAMSLFMATIGALFLLGIAILGLLSGNFFSNFLGIGKPFEIWSGGIIPLCNIAISFIVVGTFYGIFSMLALFTDKEHKS